MGLALLILAYVYAVRRDYPCQEWKGFRELFQAFRIAILPLIAPVIIVVGIVGGVFTATEAGTVVVFYALVLGFHYGELDRKTLYRPWSVPLRARR